MNLAAYVLNVYSDGPEPEQGFGPRFSDADRRLLANLPAILEATEEDLYDLLPTGYEVRITPALAGGIGAYTLTDDSWAGLVQQALDGWLKEDGISNEAAAAGTLLQELLMKEIG